MSEILTAALSLTRVFISTPRVCHRNVLWLSPGGRPDSDREEPFRGIFSAFKDVPCPSGCDVAVDYILRPLQADMLSQINFPSQWIKSAQVD